ncbi:MAG TPA: hypothetical protein VGH37_02385 [Candidatus Acidoferrum sp.]|jgi:hypothetical protein
MIHQLGPALIGARIIPHLGQDFTKLVLLLELSDFFLLCSTKKNADAAKRAADTADKSLVNTQRPWVKIKHRIVKSLTFNVAGNGGPVDSMTVEDTIENVGQSIALNVFSWEDVFPIDTPGFRWV